MSSSVDSEVSKKDGALIRPATDRARVGDAPVFFTEEALLRLEEGLRTQREQQAGRHFSQSDAASSRSGCSGAWQARGVDQPKIRAEESFPSPLGGVEVIDECLRFSQNCERWAAEEKDSQVRNAFCKIARSFAQLSRASKAMAPTSSDEQVTARTDLHDLDATVSGSTHAS